MKDGYYGVINKKGETVVPFEYNNMLCRGLYDDNCVIVHKFLKRGVINVKKDIVIPIKYDYLFLNNHPRHRTTRVISWPN